MPVVVEFESQAADDTWHMEEEALTQISAGYTRSPQTLAFDSWSWIVIRW